MRKVPFMDSANCFFENILEVGNNNGGGNGNGSEITVSGRNCKGAGSSGNGRSFSGNGDCKERESAKERSGRGCKSWYAADIEHHRCE